MDEGNAEVGKGGLRLLTGSRMTQGHMWAVAWGGKKDARAKGQGCYNQCNK